MIFEIITKGRAILHTGHRKFHPEMLWAMGDLTQYKEITIFKSEDGKTKKKISLIKGKRNVFTYKSSSNQIDFPKIRQSTKEICDLINKEIISNDVCFRRQTA